MDKSVEEKRYIFNEYQSPFDYEGSEDLEYQEFMQKILEGIPFVKHLVSPNRKRAKDLEKVRFEYAITDDAGNPTGETRVEYKIDPSITSPHILEDMDYFREAAIHFEKHGRYTNLTPNRHPRSAFTLFWKEEKRRCIEGYLRKSDGEWIPGYYYWYLNYSRISKIVTTQSTGSSSQSRGNRVESFPEVWDADYLYFHYIEKAESLGLFGVVLKTRRRGYSFKSGANPARNFTLINKSNNFLLAYDRAYLEGDGIWAKAMDNLDWVAKHTPFPRLRYINKQSDFIIKGGYKKVGSSAIYGTKSLMEGIVTSTNMDKARGIAGKYAAFEEAGKFPNLLDVWGIAESSFKQGNITFGFMVAFGTGGSEEANFQALENLFRHPSTYSILGLPNVYDFNVTTDSKVGFFSPEYLNRSNAYDKDGNSDVIKALTLIYKDRIDKKHNANDPFAIVREKAERPITPTDAMMRKTGTMFPVHLLTQYLSEIRTNESKFVAGNYIVDLYMKDGEVKWRYNKDKTPIRTYPHDPNLKHGAVEIFQLPEHNKDGTINPERYILSADTYDDDVSTTDSLGSVFVFDLFSDTIVAEYTGRPTFASDFYEIARMLCIMYNGKLNYENNKKGLYGHFRNKNSLFYLEETPEYLKQRNILKGTGGGNTSYGTPATAAVNMEGLRLQAEWLEKDCSTPLIKEDEEGNKIPYYEQNYKTVKSIAYIEEAIKWNPDNNFDRVSSMNMLMISRENRQLRLEQIKSTRIKRASDDPFFKRIFRKSGTYSFSAIDN